MGIFNKIFGEKGGAAGTAAATVAPARDLVAALSLQLRGEAGQALVACRQLEAAHPDDTLAPFLAAAALSEQGQTAGAAEMLRRLSRHVASGGDDTISRAVARSLFALMNDEPSLDIPSLGGLFVTFGDRLKGEGFLRESAVCFEIAAGILPEHAPVLYRLGDTLHDLGAYDYAEAVLAKALQCAPNHWDSLYTYAVLLQDLGRFDEAIARYEKAVKINPDHVKCHNNFGAALMLTGRLDEALEQCTLAAGLDPSFALARVNLGNIHLLKGEYGSARSCFSDALGLDDRLAPAYFGLGAVEQSSGGDLSRVRELYARAVELSPDNLQFCQALANLPATAGGQTAGA